MVEIRNTNTALKPFFPFSVPSVSVTIGIESYRIPRKREREREGDI